MVEKIFINRSKYKSTTKIPYVVVDTLPRLGLLTSLRFLEWVYANPKGVISLPTGKTPEYFIKWTQKILNDWENPKIRNLCKENGLDIPRKPDLSNLIFVQIDEFFPINPVQKNSFYDYILHYYVEGFGLNIKNCHLINSLEILETDIENIESVFQNKKIDLSLRYRDPENKIEETQKGFIHKTDQWCCNYEEKIRSLGGIGFFLGGIGPDGHIAFNIKGSDHNSTTRLLETNFETQAAAASDLGGINIARSRLVISIGLQTITYKSDAVALIIAAGEAKSKIVRDSIESKPGIQYPASVLRRLNGARFYLTEGASSKLSDVVSGVLQTTKWDPKKIEREVVNLSIRLNKFGHWLTKEDLIDDSICSDIPLIDDKTILNVLESMKKKIAKGAELSSGETFLHTGPHHDDIMLGYLPHVSHLVRDPNNNHIFANLTSGFTSVTNQYLIDILDTTVSFLIKGKIEMIEYLDFFESGYLKKKDKDIYHYLDRVASRDKRGQSRGISHRVVRIIIETYGVQSKQELLDKIKEIIKYLKECYSGEKNREDIQKVKGMIREFEEELVWSHYGVRVKDVRHLRLGFYKGDIFSDMPELERDVGPILDLLREIKPSVITLALDPEGSGPDTHYKVLQAIAESLRILKKEIDTDKIKIWGYRNVWYRFHPAEADIMIPVSLNSMATLRDTFMTCYNSQKGASFPSYLLDGPFCDLVQKIWVEQHEIMELVLGRDFWYQHEHPRIRATHGLVFLRELSVDQLIDHAQELSLSIDGDIFEL